MRIKELVKLTERQKQILKMLLWGWETVDIAKALELAERTITNHIAKIYKKFNINSYKGLIAAEKRGELNYE